MKTVHGGNIFDEYGVADDELIDFSTNINPLGMRDEARDAMRDAIERTGIYPDSRSLELSAKIAEHEGVEREQVLCGGGASDIIFRFAYAVMGLAKGSGDDVEIQKHTAAHRPATVLLTAPSFSDYERAARAAGADIEYHYLEKEKGFAIDGSIIGAIRTAAPDAVFVCNPNNPVGSLMDASLVKNIAEECRSAGAMLLVDECFLDFVDGHARFSAIPLVDGYRNIVVLKAFTKTFSMPGARLGYAVCGDIGFVEKMRSCGPDWPVSNIAQAGGIASLRDASDYLNESRNFIVEQREFLVRELMCLGMVVYPPSANFIFFYCPSGSGLAGALLERGILIRDCSNYVGLGAGYYRVAVLDEEKNKRLIEALRSALI
ncbi:MAG: aminotransferase class I/II-fold pyridoxal phosphate-dependent enzyme [Oscillospiraceae bacterium]|nr:aminotransferase class I/II-fold pyridoxal phosphate-dependent enzyme [Oscillospiraceae bacterium]